MPGEVMGGGGRGDIGFVVDIGGTLAGAFGIGDANAPGVESIAGRAVCGGASNACW